MIPSRTIRLFVSSTFSVLGWWSGSTKLSADENSCLAFRATKRIVRFHIVDAIECKWDSGAFDSTALKLFRGYYPKGRNFLVTPSGDPAYNKRYGDIEVRICTPTEIQP